MILHFATPRAGLSPLQEITLLAAVTIIGLAAYWVARRIDNRWGRYR